MKKKIALVLSVMAAASMAQATDIFWTGSTASYNTPANWSTGTVPTGTNNAINSNGLANKVQINPGDPDWQMNDLEVAGTTDSSGAFEQNGGNVTSTGWFHIANGTNSIGVYTLNAGTINVNGGRIFLSEDPNTTSTFNINGGTINKSGDVFVLADGGWNGNAARTGTVNQVNGTVNSTSEIWIGQVPLGTGIYNLHGGTINSSNWFVIGRAGGTGTLNMDGGTITEFTGGTPAFIVSDGSVGTLNFSGGTINCSNSEFWMGNNGGSLATNNISGTAVLNANNWIAVGRGGTGVLNMNGGAITKTGNGNITLSGTGIINQTNGTLTNLTSQIWIPEVGAGTYNLEGGSAILSVVHICQNGGAVGVFNADGGLLRANEISSGNIGGFSTFNFNGGTVQAAADTASWIHDLTVATVAAGGAVLDSQGFNVTIPQILSDGGTGGGLTKLGSGSVTLAGVNNYNGPTVVSAGKLIVTTDSAGAGNYSVANGADLSVKLQNQNAQLNIGNLTLGTSGAAALDADLGGFGNPSAAPFNVLGTLTVNGLITVNLGDSLPQVGQFPLIKYGSRTGSGSFTLGTIPVGVSASIVTNTVNSSIDINIAVVNLPRWDGQAGGNWDIGLTANWVNIGNGNPTFYGDGNAVLFDDNAQGTTTVNLTTTVSPLNVTLNNSNLVYSIVGSGKISGATRVVKQGTNVFSILNTGGNNYTGATVISNGVLVVTNLANGGSASSIGASSSSATNLVLAGGRLGYIGAPVTANRSFLVAAPNSGIDAQSNLTLSGSAVAVGPNSSFRKTGSGQLTLTGATNEFAIGSNPGLLVVNGTLVLDGTAGQTNHVQNEMWVGGTPDFGGNLLLTNTILNVDSWLGLGRGNGSVSNVSTMTVNNSKVSFGNVSLGYDNGIPGNLAAMTLTLNGNSSLIDRGDMNLSESTGSAATINLNGTSFMSSQNRCLLAQNASTAVMTLANSSQLVVSNGWISIGDGAGAVATMVVKDTARLTISADLNVTDVGNGCTGTLTAQDSAQVTANNIWVGKDINTVATFNITNNATVVSGNGLTMATFFDGSPRVPVSAVLNLSGGSLAVNLVQGSVTAGVNYGTFNFNGGRLIAKNPSAANFMFNLGAINVLPGGAVIDSSTFNIAIAQPLLGVGGNGGLTKVGTGKLLLNGTNTYTGTTLVSVGALGGSGTIAGPVSVASGASLAPGGSSIGTLTVNGALTFASGSSATFRLNSGTNDQVTGYSSVVYNGSLVVTNAGGTLSAGSTYHLFNGVAGTGNFTSVTLQPAGAGTFDPATGILTVTAAAAPTLNKPTVSGGNLILTGTGAAGASYTFLSTTNLTLPLSQWVTNATGTFSGTGTASNAIPLSTTNRFFLLRQP